MTREGFRRRRYLTDYGTRVTTIEVPETVWRGAGNIKHAVNRMAKWKRKQDWDRMCFESLKHKAAGWKPLASAHELGLDVRAVQRWWRQGGRKRG